MKIFAIVFLFSQLVQGAVYNCEIQENYSLTKKAQVTIEGNQRVLVRSDWAYSFYLTRLGRDMVELEAFLPAVEMRIYSKGIIEKNTVTLVSWHRDGILEFSCSIDNQELKFQ